MFARGQRRFRSDQPASYYALLLRSRGRLEERLSGKECLARLKAMGDAVSAVSLASLADLPPAPTPGALRALLAARPAAPMLALPAIDADIDGDDGGPLRAAGPAASSGDAVVGLADGSGRSVSCSAPSDASVDGEDIVPVDIPAMVLGVRVRHGTHAERGDAGLRVQCPYHKQCRLYRSFKI